MATLSPTTEYISTFLKGLLLNENRYSSAFDLAIPGLAPIKKNALGSYGIKDCSSMFKMENTRGKTQQIPTATGFTAVTRVPGVDPAYQNITRTYRNITIDTPIETSVKISKFEKDFWNLPLSEQGDIIARMARALNENVHTALFALASAATQTTFGGSNIGGATTVPTLDVYRKLRTFAEQTQKLPAEDQGHLFLNPSQALYLAGVHGFDATPSAYSKPYDALGDRGNQEYESGDVLRNIAGIKTYKSGLVADGSGATSTYNLYIHGKDKLGVGFGYISGFDVWEDKNTSETKMKFEFEYGVFALDTRAVTKVELIKNPA